MRRLKPETHYSNASERQRMHAIAALGVVESDGQQPKRDNHRTVQRDQPKQCAAVRTRSGGIRFEAPAESLALGCEE